VNYFRLSRLQRLSTFGGSTTFTTISPFIGKIPQKIVKNVEKSMKKRSIWEKLEISGVGSGPVGRCRIRPAGARTGSKCRFYGRLWACVYSNKGIQPGQLKTAFTGFKTGHGFRVCICWRRCLACWRSWLLYSWFKMGLVCLIRSGRVKIPVRDINIKKYPAYAARHKKSGPRGPLVYVVGLG
jgi:hypothetical protein